MTKLEALRSLLGKVEAGEVPDTDEVNSALMCENAKAIGWPIRQLIRWIMDPDDLRAMGAAKALHEAVLPEWHFNIATEANNARDFYVSVSPKAWGEVFIAWSETPARAWLIAQLKALIAEEEAKA